MEGNRAESSPSLDQVQDFAVYLEGIGAPGWDSLDFFDIDSILDPAQGSSQHGGETHIQSYGLRHDGLRGDDEAHSRPLISQRTPGPEAVDQELTSSVSSTVAVNEVADEAGFEHAPTLIHWKITKIQWQALADKVALLQNYLPGFMLPSRHAMSRYFQSYADQIHRHYPIIHLPTYDPISSPLCLTLAIAAIGAQHRLEPRSGHPLYEAAKILGMEQRKADSMHENDHVIDQRRTAMIQTFTLLMAYGAWDWKTELLSGALDLQSIVSGYIRSSLRDALPVDNPALPWKTWVHVETHQRAILIAYAYLIIQCTAYDLPPVVLSSELNELRLPCGSAAWEARNSQEWEDALQRSTHTSTSFGHATRYLLGQTRDDDDSMPHFSALGAFVVLQALVERIFFTRQLHRTSGGALPAAELETIQ